MTVLRLIPRCLIETPHEVAFAFIFTVYGVALLRFGTAVTPNALDDALPVWQVVAWGTCLAVGGLLNLWGRFRYVLRLESTGLALQVAGLLIYAVTIAVTVPPSGGLYLVCAVLCTLAAASIVRMWVIRRALRLVELER